MISFTHFQNRAGRVVWTCFREVNKLYTMGIEDFWFRDCRKGDKIHLTVGVYAFKNRQFILYSPSEHMHMERIVAKPDISSLTLLIQTLILIFKCKEVNF